MEAFESQYPFLLGPLAPTEIPPEFYDETDVGKNVFVVAYNGRHSVKFRGTLIGYDTTNRSIILNPLVSLNEDGTDLHVLPRRYTFPHDLLGAQQFRSSRTCISSLYDICFRQAVKNDQGFYNDPVVRMGGKSKKSKSKKSKKRKRIKQ